MKCLVRWGQRFLERLLTWVRFSKIRILFKIKYNYIKREKVSFEKGGRTVIEKNVRFLLRNSGDCKMGNNSRLCRDCKIVINGGSIILGNNVTVGEKCIFNVFDDITIGDNVLMADKINFITNEHGYKDVSRPINASPETSKKIIIGSDSWIGINATILAGTKVGKHCVIGAGSVVKGSYPDFSVIAGSPARIIKKYDFDTEKWRSYN